MVVRFIGGGNQSTRRKPPTCHKSPSQDLKNTHAESDQFKNQNRKIVETKLIPLTNKYMYMMDHFPGWVTCGRLVVFSWYSGFKKFWVSVKSTN
jgi:hypothetical protein